MKGFLSNILIIKAILSQAQSGQIRNLGVINCQYRQTFINGNCIPVSDQCLTWYYNVGCVQCQSGWSLQNGDCYSYTINVQVSDPLCAVFAPDGSCQTCAYRSIFMYGKCQQVSDQCMTWDWITGACTSCYEGWTLSNGVCSYIPSLPPTQIDPFCASFDTHGNCNACSYRTVLINGRCIPVSDLCNTWDEKTGLCISCYSGYTLTYYGTCQQ